MAIDTQRYRRRYQQEAAASGTGRWWRPDDGTHCFRVLTFKHKVEEIDFKLGFYAKGEAEIGETREEIDVAYAQHFLGKGNQPVPCTARTGNCQVCKQVAKLAKSDDEDDQRRARDMRATVRHRMNVVVTDGGGDMQVQAYDAPTSVWKALIDWLMDPEFGEKIFGHNGRDIKMKRDSKADSPRDIYKCYLRDKEMSEPLSKSLKAVDLVTDDPQRKAVLGDGKSAHTEEESEEPSFDVNATEDTETEEVEIEFVAGDTVEFDDDSGNVIQGKCVEIEGNTAYVHDPNLGDDPEEDTWEVDVSEVRLVRKRRGRRKKK